MTDPGFQLLPAADRHWTRWRNDGGATAQVAAWPPGADVGSFEWRISIAEIEEAGDFSPFPGVDRVLTALGGDGPAADPGLVLVVDGVAHNVAALEPFTFSGDSTTYSRVARPPMRDLNVMTRRDVWRSTVRIDTVEAGQPLIVPPGAADSTVAVVLSGQLEVGGAQVRFSELDALLAEGVGFELSAIGSPTTRVALIGLHAGPHFP